MKDLNVKIDPYEHRSKIRYALDQIKQLNQNEMKDLTKILKDGDEVYSVLHGRNIKIEMGDSKLTPFKISFSDIHMPYFLTPYGNIHSEGECLIFPSKEERNWDNFKRKEEFKRGEVCAFWDTIMPSQKRVGFFFGHNEQKFLEMGIDDCGNLTSFRSWQHCEKIDINELLNK